MARPQKQVVDYFPHDCDGSRALKALINRFGNDGYSLYYRLFEILGKSDGHFYDFNDAADWYDLLYDTGFSKDEERFHEVIGFMITLSIIDSDLYLNHKVIWIQEFVDSVADVYDRRKVSLPEKPTNGFSAANGKENFNPLPLDEKLADIVNIYEQNIGQSTPLIYEELKDIYDHYPDGWFKMAVGEAVKQNKRNLKYVVAIMKRWETEGVSINGTHKQGNQANGNPGGNNSKTGKGRSRIDGLRQSLD